MCIFVYVGDRNGPEPNAREYMTITETEFETLVNAFLGATGEDHVNVTIDSIQNAGDATLIEFSFEGETLSTTYAYICGDLRKNRDNDLLFFLTDWQSGEQVGIYDIANHSWTNANELIKPSEILK